VKTRLLPTRFSASGAGVFNAAWSESRVTPNRFAVSPVEYIRMGHILQFSMPQLRGV
jgi:hypothetical protein